LPRMREARQIEGQEHETRAKAGSVSRQPRQSRPRPHHRLHGRAGPRIRDAVPRPGYRTDVSSAAARIFGSGRGFGRRGDCGKALGPDAAGYGSGNHRNRDDGRRPQDRVRSDRPGRARADQHRYARPLRGREGEDLRTAQSKEGKAVRRHDALSTAEPRSRRRGGLAVSAPINGAVLVTRGPMQAYEARDAARGIDGLELVERPMPQPGAAEVLVRIRTVTLNYRDLLMVKAGYGSRQKFPLIPVSDAAGTVEAVGPGVSRFKPGERVFNSFFPNWFGGGPNEEKFAGAPGGQVDGVLSQYHVFPQHVLLHAPAHLSDIEAAALPCAGLTAWSAVVKFGAVAPGDVVLTQGSGRVYYLHCS